MSEKTKRSRSIYTVNEKSTAQVPSNATSTNLTPKHETSSLSSQRSGNLKPSGDFKTPSTIPHGRNLKDYTPEWRKTTPVGSYGDFDRGNNMMDMGYRGNTPHFASSDMLYAAKQHHEHTMFNEMMSPDSDMLYAAQNHEHTIFNEMMSPEFIKPGMAVATPHGTMSLRLRNDIKVDLSLDSSIRLINKRNNVVISLNPYGCASAFIHPHGRILQNGSKVEMLINDKNGGNNKSAKMWYKGVSFKSDFNALVYLVDAAGTRSTTDSFRDLSPDFSLSVFYDEARHGPMFVQETVATLQKATYRITDMGVEHWKIKDINITQKGDIVNVYRNDTKYSLKMTGGTSTAMLSTPFIHCTASAEHMFVRRGDRRMHFDGANFIVRNAGHSAGFDEENSLKIF